MLIPICSSLLESTGLLLVSSPPLALTLLAPCLLQLCLHQPCLYPACSSPVHALLDPTHGQQLLGAAAAGLSLGRGETILV